MPQGCDPAARDRDGCTPLYLAAAWNRLGAVKLLARIGGSAALAPSKEGRTPVHVAAEQGWSEAVRVLVRWQAILDCPAKLHNEDPDITPKPQFIWWGKLQHFMAW